MHKPTAKPAHTGTPTKKIVGGITLYAAQLAKLDAHTAARGISRSAAIRQLIDEHLH